MHARSKVVQQSKKCEGESVYIYIYIRTDYTKEKEESRVDEYIKWNGRYVEEDTRIGTV